MSFYKEVPGRQTTLESTLKFDTEPRAGSTNPVTSDGVLKSNEAIFDDKDPEDIIIEFKTDAEGAAVYDEGYYCLLDGKICLVDSITHDGAVYTITATKKNGVIPVINRLVARIKALENA